MCVGGQRVACLQVWGVFALAGFQVLSNEVTKEQEMVAGRVQRKKKEKERE